MDTTINHKNLDSKYISMLKDVDFQPVFIMGSHRSGTSILYKILSTTEHFNIVTTYHIIKYNEIIHNHINQTSDACKEQVNALFEQKQVKNRGIDQIKGSHDMPEEYGFILRNAGYSMKLKPSNLAIFLELCRKIQLTSDTKRILLLKNPWDFLNFLYLKKIFPNSKFIFIHRHPVQIINSQLKAIRSLLNTKNEHLTILMESYDQFFSQPVRLQITRFLFSSYFNIGLKIVTRNLTSATNFFTKNITLLPQDDYVCIKYESLCEEPELTVKKILNWLKLKENTCINYEPLIKVREGSLLNEIKDSKKYIFKKMKTYCEDWEYEIKD
ncbi:MAG: sulfotransferase family protein [Candidatus Anammoxibacter sp.]